MKTDRENQPEEERKKRKIRAVDVIVFTCLGLAVVCVVVLAVLAWAI